MTGEGHKDWLSDCDFHPGYDLTVQLFIFLFLFPCFTFILSWNFVVNQVNGVCRSCLKKKAMLNDHTTLVDDIENDRCWTYL